MTPHFASWTLFALTWGIATLAVPGALMADTITSPREPADLAAPRSIEHPWMSLAEWRARHAAQLCSPDRQGAELVFLGDSITEGWTDSESFESRLGALPSLNLGIGGDQTQHLLWRIEDGALFGLEPRLFVLLIGTNNLGNAYSPEETAAGVRAVIAAVTKRYPKTPLLLLSILPAGPEPSDPIRKQIAATNALLRDLASPGSISVADVGAALLGPDGTLPSELSADALHPTAKGYELLTKAAAPLIEAELAR